MTSKPALSLARQLAYLIGGVLLLWGLAAAPAGLLGGELAILESTTAAGLCLVPAVATLIWARCLAKSPELRLLLIAGGTVLRMGVVFAGGFALTQLLPEWFGWSFWIWLMVFYIFTLGLETTLLVTSKEKTNQCGLR